MASCSGSKESLFGIFRSSSTMSYYLPDILTRRSMIMAQMTGLNCLCTYAGTSIPEVMTYVYLLLSLFLIVRNPWQCGSLARACLSVLKLPSVPIGLSLLIKAMSGSSIFFGYFADRSGLIEYRFPYFAGPAPTSRRLLLRHIGH
jgi:hypothetical protein